MHDMDFFSADTDNHNYLFLLVNTDKQWCNVTKYIHFPEHSFYIFSYSIIFLCFLLHYIILIILVTSY